MATEITRIVSSRGSDGKTRTYINGALSSEGKAGGDIDNWNRRNQFGIADGEMPKDPDLLSEREARMIRGWIDNGAAWGMETVDLA